MRTGLGGWLILAVVAGCGSSGSADGPEGEDPRPSAADCVGTTVCYERNESGSEGPDVCLFGAGMSATWTERGETGLTEVTFDSGDGAVAVRAFLDPETGAFRFLVDEIAGTTLLALEDPEGEGTDTLLVSFDASGAYLDSFLFVSDGSDVRLGAIDGRPSFSGQLTGQLSPASGQGQIGSGSFAVVSTTPIRETAAGAVAFSDQVVVSPTVDRLARAAGQDPQAIGLFALATSDLGTRDGLVMPALALAVASLLQDDEAIWSETGPESGFAARQELLNWLFEVLRGDGEADASLAAALERLEASLQGSATSAPILAADDWVEAAKEGPAVESLAWTDLDTTPAGRFEPGEQGEVAVGFGLEDIEILPLVGGTASEVEGQAVFQDGSLFQCTGTIDDAGTVTLSCTDGAGSTLTITGTIDEFGNFVGTYVLETEDGTAIGSVDPLGECAVALGSGGQGTFTFAHTVGVGPGVVDFTYEAYSIPDAFDVSGPNGLVFTTGGLISGGSTVALQVDEPGPITLFVSVSAPNSGTAWDYTMGCID